MLKHSSLLFLRHLPIWSATAGTVLCLLLCTEDYLIGYFSIMAFEIFTITSGFAIVYLFSVYLGYCLLQRLGIYYTFSIIMCVWLRRYPDGVSGLFGDYIHTAHIVQAIIGIVYVSLTIYLRGGNMCRKCRCLLNKNSTNSDV